MKSTRAGVIYIFRDIFVICLFVLACTGCKIFAPSSEIKDDETEQAPVPAQQVDQCAEVCAGVPEDFTGAPDSPQALRWSSCHSCRCKVALVELPRPDELKCEDPSIGGALLKRYKPIMEDGRMVGTEEISSDLATPPADCLNTGLANHECDLKARFKRFLKNESKTEYQLLCRKRRKDSTGFWEYLLIGHNLENGATCFWQGRPNISDNDLPAKFDLSPDQAVTREEKIAYNRAFYLYSEGPSTCTGCHADDAFIWSPYLHSAWSLDDARTDRPARNRIRRSHVANYSVVRTNMAEPDPVRKTDLTENAGPMRQTCGICHRLTSSACGFANRSLNYNPSLMKSSSNPTGIEPIDMYQHAAHLSYFMPYDSVDYAEIERAREIVEQACSPGRGRGFTLQEANPFASSSPDLAKLYWFYHEKGMQGLFEKQENVEYQSLCLEQPAMHHCLKP